MTTARAVGDAPDGAWAGGPVIVLTYAYSGAELLQSVLSRHPDLACTSATGLLPLCEQAAETWRVIEAQPEGPPSALAARSIRGTVTAMVTSVLSWHGKRRWCETATASPAYVETFLQLFPGTRVLCLYRSCPDVIQAALRASHWGLAGDAFAPYTSAHPASTVAALTAYWTARAGQLLAFERAQPSCARRVRYEDLGAGPRDDLWAFLGMSGPDPGGRGRADTTTSSQASPRQWLPFPADQVPPGLLRRANELMQELGYPILGAATSRPAVSQPPGQQGDGAADAGPGGGENHTMHSGR
jgi:Sulfotransferase family